MNFFENPYGVLQQILSFGSIDLRFFHYFPQGILPLMMILGIFSSRKSWKNHELMQPYFTALWLILSGLLMLQGIKIFLNPFGFWGNASSPLQMTPQKRILLWVLNLIFLVHIFFCYFSNRGKKLFSSRGLWSYLLLFLGFSFMVVVKDFVFLGISSTFIFLGTIGLVDSFLSPTALKKHVLLFVFWNQVFLYFLLIGIIVLCLLEGQSTLFSSLENLKSFHSSHTSLGYFLYLLFLFSQCGFHGFSFGFFKIASFLPSSVFSVLWTSSFLVSLSLFSLSLSFYLEKNIIFISFLILIGLLRSFTSMRFKEKSYFIIQTLFLVCFYIPFPLAYLLLLSFSLFWNMVHLCEENVHENLLVEEMKGSYAENPWWIRILFIFFFCFPVFIILIGLFLKPHWVFIFSIFFLMASFFHFKPLFSPFPHERTYIGICAEDARKPYTFWYLFYASFMILSFFLMKFFFPL